jgi:hypothetical protein
MQLEVMYVDMRGGYAVGQSWTTDVIDKETNKKVGFVYQRTCPPKGSFLFFGGKYVGTDEEIISWLKRRERRQAREETDPDKP